MVLKSSKYAQRTLIHIGFFLNLIIYLMYYTVIYHDLKVEK